MANYFNLSLDTLGPASPSIELAGGAAFSSVRDITATIGTSDGDTTGYQMKIWGDVDPAFDAQVQPLEGNSAWISYSASKAIRLATGDGAKTVYLKIRDDVLNISNQASDGITLDTTVPVVTIGAGPDVTKVSKQATKDTCSFSFTVNENIQAYKVKVVPATGSLENAGTQIPVTAGSTNMSGGAVSSGTPVNCTIKGTDLETASGGDGSKIVKVFAQGVDGSWSV